MIHSVQTKLDIAATAPLPPSNHCGRLLSSLTLSLDVRWYTTQHARHAQTTWKRRAPLMRRSNLSQLGCRRSRAGVAVGGGPVRGESDVSSSLHSTRAKHDRDNVAILRRGHRQHERRRRRV